MTEPKPLQRLVMVTGILTAAGPQGRPAGNSPMGRVPGTPESRREQLARLIRGLQGIGVDIVNVAPRVMRRTGCCGRRTAGSDSHSP